MNISFAISGYVLDCLHNIVCFVFQVSFVLRMMPDIFFAFVYSFRNIYLIFSFYSCNQ